jgi:uncharacterized membrane protein YkvA (DUF1232 family)
MVDFFKTLKQQVKRLKQNVVALYYASRSDEVPFVAKLIAAFTVGYLLSPIDLIPDFIPVLGILDDLILVPLLIRLTIRLIPESAWLKCTEQAANNPLVLKKSRPFAVLIVLLWIICAAFMWLWWRSG